MPVNYLRSKDMINTGVDFWQCPQILSDFRSKHKIHIL